MRADEVVNEFDVVLFSVSMLHGDHDVREAMVCFI